MVASVGVLRRVEADGNLDSRCQTHKLVSCAVLISGRSTIKLYDSSNLFPCLPSHTGRPFMACTWFGEASSCPCLGLLHLVTLIPSKLSPTRLYFPAGRLSLGGSAVGGGRGSAVPPGARAEPDGGGGADAGRVGGAAGGAARRRILPRQRAPQGLGSRPLQPEDCRQGMY